MSSFRFAHLADCHIGSWRDPKLRDFSLKAFKKAIDVSIEKKADFILIAGDLFNTSLPTVDNLKHVVRILRHLHKQSIPVYIIAGSHDYSPSGRTILDVLEEAGLANNVFKGEILGEQLKLNFTVDKKTGAKLTGILGRKGTLEKSYYRDLTRDNLENEPGYKIFMLHSAITELKPQYLSDMDSSPISFLPKNFNYYAAGHVHIVKEYHDDVYSSVVYPGPIYPNSFSELEKLGKGGFYFVTVEDDKTTQEFIPIIFNPIESINMDCNNLSPEQVKQKLFAMMEKKEYYDSIILLRLHGILSSGIASDIPFKEIIESFYTKGAYFVMKNTFKLSSKEFEHIQIHSSSQEDIESSMIDEHLGKFPFRHNAIDEKSLVLSLLQSLSKEKLEGERVADFESRVKDDFSNLLKSSTKRG